MACAVPVVAFAEGPAADILIHRVSGVLVERGNTYALADALRALLTSEPRRYAYAVAGLSRVQERFAWPRVAEQIEALYRTAIADRRGRPAVIEMQDS
jgi:glycosyltransferase involved in cell wall biosynthesis